LARRARGSCPRPNRQHMGWPRWRESTSRARGQHQRPTSHHGHRDPGRQPGTCSGRRGGSCPVLGSHRRTGCRRLGCQGHLPGARKNSLAGTPRHTAGPVAALNRLAAGRNWVTGVITQANGGWKNCGASERSARPPRKPRVLAVAGGAGNDLLRCFGAGTPRRTAPCWVAPGPRGEAVAQRAAGRGAAEGEAPGRNVGPVRALGLAEAGPRGRALRQPTWTSRPASGAERPAAPPCQTIRRTWDGPAPTETAKGWAAPNITRRYLGAGLATTRLG